MILVLEDRIYYQAPESNKYVFHGDNDKIGPFGRFWFTELF